MGRGDLYFCCKSGGAAQLGQIMRYRPAPDEGQCGEGGMVQVFVEWCPKGIWWSARINIPISSPTG